MSEVAKWKMGKRLGAEWERLRKEEEGLIIEAAPQLTPIIQRPADRSRGEIFPLVWYGSDIEVTALQHFILGRMILVAEDPSLQYAPIPKSLDKVRTEGYNGTQSIKSER
ncbi:hypothetical protein COL922a_010401 [Colletotrichum nupharicola]|nr:hypothetical protein COL922a_010401 [Colletotrichum nupharicola]